MSETLEKVDLWGDLVTEPIRTPLNILKEQGGLLERKTNGILTVEVKTDVLSENNLFSIVNPFNKNDLPKNGDFRFSFYIESASLNYSYRLFSVSQPIELFPIVFHIEGEDNLIATDEKEFITILGDILQSSKTQKIINSLLSQSIAA